jgi:hypothetical protein
LGTALRTWHILDLLSDLLDAEIRIQVEEIDLEGGGC